MIPPSDRTLVIGLAGGTGSGKTTIVAEILRGVPPGAVAVLHHDAYYRNRSDVPARERDGLNFDHPEALETPLLVRHLRELKEGRPVEVPVYDFRTHTRRGETVRVDPAPVVVVEGILVLADPALRDELDVKVYVEEADDVRLVRRLLRDVEERGRTVRSVVSQYLETVRPMHRTYVEPTRRFADLVLPPGAERSGAVAVLRSLVLAAAEAWAGGGEGRPG